MNEDQDRHCALKLNTCEEMVVVFLACSSFVHLGFPKMYDSVWHMFSKTYHCAMMFFLRLPFEFNCQRYSHQQNPST